MKRIFKIILELVLVGMFVILLFDQDEVIKKKIDNYFYEREIKKYEEFYEKNGYIDAKVRFSYQFVEYDSVGDDISLDIGLHNKVIEDFSVIRINALETNFLVKVTENDTINDIAYGNIKVKIPNIFETKMGSTEITINENGGRRYSDASGVVKVIIKFEFKKE